MDKGKIGLGIIVVAVVMLLVIFGMYISASNTEISLRNQYVAQVRNNESSFDKMWKIIQQQSGVAETERETFKNTYVEIMEAQQGIAGKGSLASFFQQSGITLSSETFSKLMITIEAQRESFNRDQQKLIEIVRNHDNVRTRFPSSMFVGGREALKPIVITSGKTQSVFANGQDNDIELFKK